MANEEKVVFLALELTERGGLASPLPLWNSFRGDNVFYAHNKIRSMAVDVLDSNLKLTERWEKKVTSYLFLIDPKDSASTCGFWEALKHLEEASRDATLFVLNFKELLFLQITCICWRVELRPKRYLDLPSYMHGIAVARGLPLDTNIVAQIAQEVQKERGLRARLDYCVGVYRALHKPSDTAKPAEKDSNIWPEPGCYGSSCIGC